jgi:hypothetical protein
MPEIKNFSGKKSQAQKNFTKNSFSKKIQPIFKNGNEGFH